MIRRLFLVLKRGWFVCCLCLPMAVRAQDGSNTVIPEPLSSDRPGFGVETNVLALGTIQLESGWMVTSQSEGNAIKRTFEAGNPLLRIGLGHRMEASVGADGFVIARRAGDVLQRAAGASDLSVVIKYALVSEKGLRPALTLIPSLSLPAGHRYFSSGGYDPTLTLAWSKSLGKATALSGNLGLSSVSDSSGRLAQSAVSFQLSRDVWRGFAGFWEAYLVTPVDRDHDHVWTFDTGLTHPIGRNVQVDASVGQQIAPIARCWFVSAGVAVRYSALWGVHP